MRCDERQRLMASGIVLADGVAHVRACDKCTEALISSTMTADVNVLFEFRQLSAPSLLLWKARIRKKRRAQEPIEIISDVAILCLYVMGLLGAVGVLLLALIRDRPSGSVIWFPETYPLSSIALCFLLGGSVLAVGTAAREIVNCYIFLARRPFATPVIGARRSSS